MSDQVRATRWRAPDEPCLNCGDPTSGRFCPSCGQRKADVAVSVRTLLADVLEDQLVLNRALPRTLAGLLFLPGKLTAEYIRGRIVRYVAPFRLYLATSIAFFLLFSVIGLGALQRGDLNVRMSAQPATIDVDSLRTVLLDRERDLQATDTVEMPAPLRALLRRTHESTEAALVLLEDTAALADPTIRAELLRQARGVPAIGARDWQPWAQELVYDIPAPWLRDAVDRKLARIGHLPPREAFRTVLEDMLEYAPHLVFLLLPVFALMLKTLYIRRGRYYAEHFVFALHVHAFFFLAFIIILLLPWGWVDAVLVGWMVLYVWLAMRRVYGQGWFRTTVKWSALGCVYSFLLVFGLVALTIATLLFV